MVIKTKKINAINNSFIYRQLTTVPFCKTESVVLSPFFFNILKPKSLLSPLKSEAP